MHRNLTFWLTIALTVVALVASAILLVDYVRPSPVFCAAEGGCGAVRLTAYARPLGVPLPLFGVMGVLAVGLLALLPGRAPRRVQAVAGVVGGLVAAFLIFVQVRLRTICPYCAAVDGAALGLAALSIVRAVRGWDPPAGKVVLGLGLVGFVAAVGAPLAFGLTRPEPPEPPLPDAVAEIVAKTPPGMVTVVDFVDYECPFCRSTHAELAPLLAERRDKVRVVRKNVPLRMHPHAADAARVAVCAERMGRGDAMSDLLFATAPEALVPDNLVASAVGLGLAEGEFRACLADPATEASVRADTEFYRKTGPEGLPTLFIGKKRFVGAQDRDTLRAALDAAQRAR